MRERPVVLLLVANADQRESARRELAALDVCPVAVAADTATEALSFYQPISVVLDEAHAAVAPEEFFELTCARRVRLVTLPDSHRPAEVSEAALRDAASPRADA